MGASKYMGGVETYNGIQTYGWFPNMGPSKHMGGVQTYGSIQTYWVPSKHMGHPNIQGASTHMGHTNVWGHMDTPLV